MPFWHQYSTAWYRSAAWPWQVKLLVVVAATVVPLFGLVWLKQGQHPYACWQQYGDACLYSNHKQDYAVLHQQVCGQLDAIKLCAQQYALLKQQPATASTVQALCCFQRLCQEYDVLCSAIKPLDVERVGALTLVTYAVTLQAEFRQIVAFCTALGTTCPTWSMYPTTITRTQRGAVDAELLLTLGIASTKEPVYVPSQGHSTVGDFGTHTTGWQRQGAASST